MRVALVYDIDACRGPTGVTRHALAQLEKFRNRPDVDIQLISGRLHDPDGLAYWEGLDSLRRRELPIRTRDALRWWRIKPWPPIDWWTGKVDWVYCPSEYEIPTRTARRAVTSHDVHQNLQSHPKFRERLGKTFGNANLILSVSNFNTERLLEAFPDCKDRVAYVPNAADDLFYEPATPREREGVRNDLGLPPGIPYLLSVANFQPRKNLVRFIKAASRLPEVTGGELAIVLLGEGGEAESQAIREAVTATGRRAVFATPGYRQGRALRAAYAEATALVFPSLCESFGIPAIEAMAQGIPVALADSTALPEVGGEAGWYFPPEDEDAISSTLWNILDKHDERARKVALGREIAGRFRWQASNDLLVAALAKHR